MGASSVVGAKHTSRVRLTLRISPHQVTSLLIMFDTFSEKHTFFKSLLLLLSIELNIKC